MLQLTFLTYLLLLIYFGFVKRGDNWLGWFMFVRASFCEAEIRCGTQEINVWDYLPHSQVVVHRDALNRLMLYLHKQHGLYPLSGEVRLHTNNGTITFRVRRAWLIPQRSVDIAAR